MPVVFEHVTAGRRNALRGYPRSYLLSCFLVGHSPEVAPGNATPRPARGPLPVAFHVAPELVRAAPEARSEFR